MSAYLQGGLSAFGPTLAAFALPALAGAFVLSPAQAQTQTQTQAQAQAQAQDASAAMLPERAPDAVLTGTITGADHQTYPRIPFTMPEGVDRLVVAFDYGGRERKTVIDLGVEDPHGFRGASGGNKPHFTIARSDATPSYLPGPLDAGEWALALAVPNIRAGTTAGWQARIWFLSGAEAQMLPSPTAGRGPGWYRGDLHMHTGESDGACDSQAGRRVPCPFFRTLQQAAARDLDFVAVTEHNTTSHAGPLYAAQPYFDDMLLIPGREITTFFGHFNIFGVTSHIDYRIAPETGAGFNAIADKVHELGGIVSINHPGLPSGEICMGCGWTMDEASPGESVDYARADAVEVVNGSGTASADGDAEGIVSGIPFWTDRLGEGHALAPLGGSDNHDPDRHGLGAIGAPVSVVEAADLTAPALFAGIRAGRSFVVMPAADADMHMDFTVSAGGEQAPMGGELAVSQGTPLQLSPAISARAGSIVEIYDGGERLESFLVAAAARDGVALHLDPGMHPIHLRIRSGTGRLLAIGNAVRVRVRAAP